MTANESLESASFIQDPTTNPEWPDSDATSSSSPTTNSTYVGITRHAHFPPLLPSIDSSGNISKSLPQRLAATISLFEPDLAVRSRSASRPRNTTKSQSPIDYRRRLTSPPVSQKSNLFTLAPSSISTNASSARPIPHTHQSQPTSTTAPFAATAGTAASLQDSLPETPHYLTTSRNFTAREGKHTHFELGEREHVLDQYETDDAGDDEDVDGLDETSNSPSHGRSSERGSFNRLAESYSRLRSQRIALSDVFNGVRSRRSQIQNLRFQKDQADLAFVRAVLPVLPNLARGLQLLYNEVQNARSLCQKAEQDFDSLIDNLEDGYADLELEERRFYTIAAGADSVVSDDDDLSDDGRSRSSEDLDLRGISGDRPEVVDPLFGDFREVLGELQLARELLINTRMKRQALLAGKSQTLDEDSLELLQTYGEPGRKRALSLKRAKLMTREDIEALQNYDELEQQATQEIKTWTEQAKHLEERCQKQGVIPEHYATWHSDSGFDPTIKNDIYLGSETTSKAKPSLAHPVFPILLSNPSHLLESFPKTPDQSLRMAISLPSTLPTRQQHIDGAAREVNIQSLFADIAGEDKTDYVNRWLLHKLHVSPMDAEILWSTFSTRLKILDKECWQQDVLHNWWRDEAADRSMASFKSTYAGRSSLSMGSLRSYGAKSSPEPI